MPSFVDVTNGNSAQASDIQQVIDALKGTVGKGIPLSPTAVNDAINYALSVKNTDAGASKAAIFYKSDGSVLLQVDKNGVLASPDGTATAAQIVTTSTTQTLTNKTLGSAVLTSPVINGTLTGGAGFNAWTGWTPTLSQSGALTLSAAQGSYTQVGKIVIATVNITVNSSGTAGVEIQLGGLPVAAQTRGGVCFGIYNRNVGPAYVVVGTWISGTTVQFYSGGVNNRLGNTPNFAAAASDSLQATLVYEAT